MRELSLDEVEKLLKTGIAYALSKGYPSSVAVVDMGGNLRGALRPERGRIVNISIAQNKAWTAVAFQRPTSMLTQRLSPGGTGYGLIQTDSRICITPGGYPIFDTDGSVIAGIGASGASAAEDQFTCLAALKAGGFPTTFSDPTTPQQERERA
jgi:uncharacterized protein GlcG (DUF336 family)